MILQARRPSRLPSSRPTPFANAADSTCTPNASGADGRLGILVTRCPECGSHQAAGKSTSVSSNWLKRVAMLGLLGWIAVALTFIVGAFFHAPGHHGFERAGIDCPHAGNHRRPARAALLLRQHAAKLHRDRRTNRTRRCRKKPSSRGSDSCRPLAERQDRTRTAIETSSRSGPSS